MYELDTWIIGKAQPDDDGVGHLENMLGLPCEMGPDAPIGMTWAELFALPWFKGRNPIKDIGRDLQGNIVDPGDLFWVDGKALPVYSSRVVTAGVQSMGGLPGIKGESLEFHPEPDDVPYVAIIGATVRGADEADAVSAATDLHTSARYRVLAAWPRDPEADVPAQLDGWEFAEPFTPTRWAQLRNPLVNQMGVDAGQIDGWWTAGGSDRTPVEFVRALVGLWRKS